MCWSGEKNWGGSAPVPLWHCSLQERASGLAVKRDHWSGGTGQAMLQDWRLHSKHYYARLMVGLGVGSLNPVSSATQFRCSSCLGQWPRSHGQACVCFRGWPSYSGGNSCPFLLLPQSSTWAWHHAQCVWWNPSHVCLSQYTLRFTTFEPVICSDSGELMTSGFYLLIVHVYFVFTDCVYDRNWAYLHHNSIKNRVTKIQPYIRWGPPRRTTLSFFRNLLEIMLVGLSKRPPLKWDWRENHSGWLLPKFSQLLQ
jgi:hypothetical protein